MRPTSAVPLWLKVTALIGLVAFAVWVNVRAADMEVFRETAAAAGYPGLFAASVVSGFNLVAPIPVALFHPFLMSGEQRCCFPFKAPCRPGASAALGARAD